MRTGRSHRWVTLLLATLVPLAALAPSPAAADRKEDRVIVLPGASSAEGITAGRGSTFYAGDLFRGDIFRGNVRRGTAELFIDAPDGRMAVGLGADLRHKLLFVAGGPTGQAFVYDLASGATVATYQLGAFINDVTVTRQGAWFTDSQQGQLYFVPVDRHGDPGAATTLVLSGPAADTSSDFNLNGIRATRDGRTLIVAHSGNGALSTVDAATGSSALIAGVDVPNVDGIELSGHRLWAVQNMDNQIAEVKLAPDLSSGRVVDTITSEFFQVPTTVAKFGRLLAAVNAKFDTGFPPTADRYEVVIVRS